MNLKKKFDIVIYDASSGLSEQAFKVFPLLDRLFIVGEKDVKFLELLHHFIQINKVFDSNQIQDRTIPLIEDEHNIGFTKPKDNIEETCKIIYNDYCNKYLQRNYMDQYNKILMKLKKSKSENISKVAYASGLDFEKSVLLQEFIHLRELQGQTRSDAIETLLAFSVQHNYDEILHQFQSEMYIVQFKHARTSETKPKNETKPKI